MIFLQHNTFPQLGLILISELTFHHLTSFYMFQPPLPSPRLLQNPNFGHRFVCHYPLAFSKIQRYDFSASESWSVLKWHDIDFLQDDYPIKNVFSAVAVQKYIHVKFSREIYKWEAPVLSKSEFYLKFRWKTKMNIRFTNLARSLIKRPGTLYLQPVNMIWTNILHIFVHVFVFL